VGVDAVARRDIWRLLKEINAGGTTILLTTHYMEEAHFLCDEIGLMNSGEILQQDTPDGLINRLGETAVETSQSTKYFKTIPEAKVYAESLSQMYTMRKTTLEDVFISMSEGATL
jgi:ABC-2 type transport system ATP-binding protein